MGEALHLRADSLLTILLFFLEFFRFQETQLNFVHKEGYGMS